MWACLLALWVFFERIGASMETEGLEAVFFCCCCFCCVGCRCFFLCFFACCAINIYVFIDIHVVVYACTYEGIYMISWAESTFLFCSAFDFFCAWVGLMRTMMMCSHVHSFPWRYGMANEKKLSHAWYAAVKPLMLLQNSLSLKIARVSVRRLRIMMRARTGHRSPYLRKVASQNYNKVLGCKFLLVVNR